jgi:hypothetical protein
MLILLEQGHWVQFDSPTRSHWDFCFSARHALSLNQSHDDQMNGPGDHPS